MGDTYTRECKKCGLETDLIMGVCEECVLKVGKTSEKLISVLCNSEGKVCIAGSPLDREILQECIEEVKKIESSYPEPKKKLDVEKVEKYLHLKLQQLLVDDSPDEKGYTKSNILAQAIVEAFNKGEL